MASLSREKAQRFVDKIKEDNGGISFEDRKATPPSVLRALANVRRKLGAATKTLATSLYSTDTRFVYELIQNAEDNQYTRAEAAGVVPYLSFSMYPDKIVIDSNEDGFKDEHVKAICSTGESTKISSRGYIGEKGIGFKSVFKVAKRVHIQSETFSFSFEYTRESDDDGLGMVTPLNDEYYDLPENVSTRITLTLLDASTFDKCLPDLVNIPEALLLFLTKLEALHINIYPQAKGAMETKYTHLIESNTGIESIERTTTIAGQSTVHKSDFFTTRKEVSNLPYDDARKHTNHATVVLAFPIHHNHVPLIEPQHVFAFLPLRSAGFTFLIQSDFVTQASREDVFHSLRNEALLCSVAETFRDAVLQFCEHPRLQYLWMRYLPDDSVFDEFWKKLRPKIISLLSDTRCLRSRSEKSLYLPKQLCWVAKDVRDQYDEPLFADLADEIYLSGNYLFSDFGRLKQLGTSLLNFQSIIARIRADLGRADSRLKSIVTDDDWHTKTAELLSAVFGKGGNSILMENVKSLELIPLQDNQWLCARCLPIYQPKTGDVPIPTDLGFRLIHPTAVTNAARRRLFSYLGVTAAVPSNIISSISERYVGFRNVSLEDSISHLRYLYWNLPEHVSVLDKNIVLLDQNLSLVFRIGPREKYIYFDEAEEEYGAKQLLQYPGVSFLNAAYLSAVPVEACHHGRSWNSWLEEIAGVQRFPHLQNQSHSALSDEFKYIIKHRSEKLIGLLKRHWSFYEPQMLGEILEEIRWSKVPADGGMMLALQDTFIPLPQLKSIIERLHISKFPFLITPEEPKDKNEAEWQFLKRFGVKDGDGSDLLYFYMKALHIIASENEGECRREVLDALFEVYGAIERTCSSKDDMLYVQNDFKKMEWIYIPPCGGQYAKWVSSENCVWSGPEWLEGKQRLSGVSKFADREHLFRSILKIGNADWNDFVGDLEKLKEQGRGDKVRILAIYRCLQREFEHEPNYEILRTSLEGSKLVFVPLQNAWYPLSSCIWADDQACIPRKVPISTPYTSLEDFFVKMLGVPKPNLAMHVQALRELSLGQPSAPEVKNIIKLISSMNPTAEDVKDLQSSNIFSVKRTTGETAFTNKHSDFAIIDRPEYGEAFAGKIRILDFSIQEARACRPLLLALGMERKYLSALVEEKTEVQDGWMMPDLSQSFKSRAYALFRLSVHYNSPKSRNGDKSLYDLLLRSSIYLSDGITKSISLVQYGETVSVENSRANFHLDDSGDELRLYVPRDEDAREECYFRQLPRRLIAYLAISDPTAEAILSGLIGCKNLVVVDRILRDAGISEVDGIDRPTIPDLGAEAVHYGDSSDGTESRSSQSGRSISTSTSTSSIVSIVANQNSNINHRSPSVMDRSPASSIAPSTPPARDLSVLVPSSIEPSMPPARDLSVPMPSIEQPLPAPGYATLLERVINNAGRISIPARGTSAIDASPNALHFRYFPFDTIFTSRSFERDRMVGAAGELYIFEMLLKLDLFNFTRENWKSNVREKVRVHDKYRDLEPWHGSETADITYLDARGDFTKLLIDKGYLHKETWMNERPLYYLEVKTSTKECGQKFFMSDPQYRLMQRTKLQPQRATSEIYIILRVFDLEQRTGLRVYVDPESCRLNGELDFGVDTWAVKDTGYLANN